ncbi:WD40 repeat-like protein [Mycena venus]|uniref:WD40 repeat-like protein n=1 Tax=Mycena venus TaxID=2733690 RepID=A0A8H6XGZ6_9AGAR|nr:WD40 repeat-like protein [Mycena venus]
MVSLDSTPMSPNYLLLVRTVEGMERIGWLRHKPNLFVAIHWDGVEVQRTPTIKRQLAPKWEYLMKISAAPSSTISLRLFHDSSFPLMGDECLGTLDITVSELRELCRSDKETKVVKLRLTSAEANLTGKAATTISVCLMTDNEAAEMAAATAPKDGAKSSATMGAAEIVAQAVSTAVQFESALGVLTSKLEIIVGIGDQIAAIHPYANIAWKVLTSVYQVAKRQRDTDAKFVTLVETMVDVYSFVGDVESLPRKIKSLENKALAIVQQTVECALFIQEYTSRNFRDRAVQGIWNRTEQKIDELSAAFRKLKESSDDRLKIESFFVSTKILGGVERLEQSDMLKKLNPVDMNASLRDECLPGTRRKTLDDIAEWVTVTPGPTNVLWLSGVAGSGKSTISTTVSESFREIDRLGAFLFFDRNHSTRSDPGAVIRTIAYSLALFNSHIGDAISATIRRGPAIVNAPIRKQFKTLLLDPLKSAEQHIQGSILIILDALDECGDVRSRAPLLSLLAEEFPNIPPLFRLLITSRREPDIADKFASRFLEMDMGAVSNEESLWNRFTSVDTDRSGAVMDRSGEITAVELKCALMKGGDWTSFDLDTVKHLMTIFDTDHSGTITFNEFLGLWKYLMDWQDKFNDFDADRSGSIDLEEMDKALKSFGYKLSPHLIMLVQRKYDAKAFAPLASNPQTGVGAISFDRFVRACAVIRQLHESFLRLDTNGDGWIDIGYEVFMEMALSPP